MKYQEAYLRYPTVKGIVHVKDQDEKHLFTMWTDNIRARVQFVDAQWRNGLKSDWSQHRKDVAQQANRLIYEYIAMPNAEMSDIRKVAEFCDQQGLAFQLSKVAMKVA
jgi:O-acetylhomoserine/O-acetylserine sulfhydrylase-like pyridoxal-dependent enzyme